MALTQADKEFIAASIAAALAAVVVPAQAAPVAAPVASEHIGPSGKPDGRVHPCTADGGCGKFTRSAKTAASHDSATAHWHSAAK